MIYLDTSALVKLVRVENESAALINWIDDRPDEQLVASTLVEIELPRALRRHQEAALGSVAPILRKLYRIEMSATVRATAAAYQEPALRSLDAIHLATAEFLIASGAALTAFITYNRRLETTAKILGMAVVAPAP